MKFLLLSLFLTGCTVFSDSAIERRLQDIMVQNEDLRRRVIDLQDDVWELGVALKEKECK